MTLWVWVVAIAVALLLAGERRGVFSIKAPCKLAAATGFLGVAWSSGALDSGYGIAVLAALSFSWIGDACLLFRRERVFLAGIGAFLLGHVGFIVAFAVRGVSLPWAVAALIPLGAAGLAFYRWIAPHVSGSLVIPVRAYTAVISGMAALAFGCLGAGHSWLIPAGATAFFLSDITVALDRFVSERFVYRLIGLPLYFGAQVLLALSVGAT